jgi:hypothetical protein
MAKGSPGLALLLSDSSKAKGGEEESDSEDEGEDYSDLAKEAFPDEDWSPERLAAFKELVMSCMGKG